MNGGSSAARLRVEGTFSQVAIAKGWSGVAMPPSSALLIGYKWAKRILKNEKVWEIRCQSTKKRGRICIAGTANTSPNHAAMILGEATLTACIKVGERRGSFLSAPQDEPSNFLCLRHNLSKHRLYSVSKLLRFVPASKKAAYAWVLTDAVLYPEPIKLPYKRGRIVWAKLSG